MESDPRASQRLHRIERARRVVSHCSQATIRAYDEEALLAEACRHLVDVGDYSLAWFAESKVGATHLTLLAHAAAEASGVRGDQAPWTTDLGPRTPTMKALLEQRPQVVRGIPGNPALRKRHPEAEALGFAAICAFPIQFGLHGAGVLTIHSREADAFAPEEVALLRELAGDLAVGISLLRGRKANDALEERLERAERRFRSIVEHAPLGIAQVAADGKVVVANRQLARILGYGKPGENGVERPESLSRHLEDADAEQLRRSLVEGAPSSPFEVELRRVDGQGVWVEIQVQPANGGSKGVIEAFVRDLTLERLARSAETAQEQQRMEVVRLEELNRMRAEFMGRASHELNTPLTPILLQVQALQLPGLDTRQARGLALIERNVLRLSALVKDLLQASVIEAREVHPNPALFDLGAKVAEVAQSFAGQAKAADVEVRLEPREAMVFADVNLVTQILFNLLGNAIKYTLEGGTVRVECTSDADQVTCTVADTGRGFSPADGARLFTPFTRLHEDIPGSPTGTGLGLFISKALVEQSGGTLSATSPGPGLGASFTFQLPAGAPAKDTPPGRGIRSVRGFPGPGAEASSATGAAAPAGEAPEPGESQEAVRTRSR